MPDVTVMRDAPVLEVVREVRHRISESVGHDPHRLGARQAHPRGQPRAAARRMMQRKPQPDRHAEDWGREPA